MRIYICIPMERGMLKFLYNEIDPPTALGFYIFYYALHKTILIKVVNEEANESFFKELFLGIKFWAKFILY